MFRSLLEHIQYEIYCGIDNVDMLSWTFISDVTTAYDSAYPIISRRKKVLDICKPYVNQELKKMIKQKHRIERKYFKYPITYNAEYRCLRNRVKKLMEKVRKLYYTNKVETGVNKPKA